jgi:hypothetical protein
MRSLPAIVISSEPMPAPAMMMAGVHERRSTVSRTITPTARIGITIGPPMTE